jgi:hypothetical protein
MQLAGRKLVPAARRPVHLLVTGVNQRVDGRPADKATAADELQARARDFVARSGAHVDRRFFLRTSPTIAHRALMLIAALGLMSVLANWYRLHAIERIDAANSVVTEHIAPARLALSEAKGALTAFGLDVYQMSASDDRAQIAEQANAMVGEFNAIANALDNVRGYYPERTDDIAQVLAKLEALHTLADEVHGLTVDRKREQAGFVLELKFSAALDDAVFHLNRLINILGRARRAPGRRPRPRAARPSRSPAWGWEEERWRRWRWRSRSANIRWPGRCAGWRTP